jgi:hypothetical protein
MHRFLFTFFLLFATQFAFASQALVPAAKAAIKLERKSLKEKFISKYHRIENALGIGAQADAKMDGLAVAGFVCSIVGLFVAGILLGSLGVIFSLVAMKRIKKAEGTRRGGGLAIAGFIIGLIAIIGALIVLAEMRP